MGLCTGVGGSGCVGVDGTDDVGSDGGVDGGCGDSDSVESTGGS